MIDSELRLAPIPPEIEDEQCLGIHKVPAHSVLVPYATLEEALAADRTKSGYALSLNGDWKFHWVKTPELRPVEFFEPAYDVSEWDTITVPSNWQVLGYGTPYYRNIGYTFQPDWPKVMNEPPKNWTAYDERNPVGSYKRKFTVPSEWEGRQIFLKFEGVDAGFFLWVNGEKVGYSQNSRNAAEFDITPFVCEGENDLAVEVYRYTSGSYFEDQDMWRLSGIYRNVTLWSAPKLHIQDTFLTTDLDAEYRDATLKVVAKIHNYDEATSEPCRLMVSLYEMGLEGSVEVGPIAPGEESTVVLSVHVPNPQKWTAETPNLYTALIRLGDEELLSHRIGFRKIEVKGRVFTVNGQPVKLKGANRHEMSPETGHTVSEADMIEDLVMLKRANCNHVRTSHYPDDPRWYELCDEWGIYLVGEANTESHGLYGVIDREPRFERMVVDRNVANVEEFKNHASIVMWSLGNECGGGSNFHAALKAVEALDTTRPTHYEPFGRGAQNPASIDSHMYTDPAGTERIANDPTLTKPFYLCEYAHAMNNSMGSIGEYNDLFDQYPALMGGAIWEWEDQGLWNRRDPNRHYIAYGGGFGEEPNDGYFIHKGVVFSDRSPKPHFPEVKRAYQWIGFEKVDGGVRTTNRFSFTNLAKYAFEWEYVSDKGVLESGQLAEISLAPLESMVVEIPEIESSSQDYLYLNIRAVLKEDESWAQKGYAIAAAQFAVHVPQPSETPIPSGDLDVQESEGDIRVLGTDFGVTFDRARGTISELMRNGQNVFVPGGGPTLHLWRAQHRRDDAWAAKGWDKTGLRDLTPEVLDLRTEKRASGEVVLFSSIRYAGQSDFSVLHLIRTTVYADGTVAVDNGVSPMGPNVALGRVGVRMLLDPSYESVEYFARGPMENYSDRKRGSDMGRYTSTVADEMTPYPKPQECGNHEDMRWLSLTSLSSPSFVAAADGQSLQFSTLPYRDEEMENVAYDVDLPVSSATVLVLSGLTLGVGSNACGPLPLPPYRIDCTPFAFSYVLRLGAEAGQLAVPKRDEGPMLVRVDSDYKASLVASSPVEVSHDGENWSESGEPILVTEPTKLWVRSAGFTGAVMLQPAPARSGWQVTASSFEESEGNPRHILDGDPAKIWHSQHSSDRAALPHWLVVDFGTELEVGQVRLTPRPDGPNGRIRDFELYVSEDGQNWGELVGQGTMPDNEEGGAVRLDVVRRARYLKVVIVSEWSGNGFGSLSEIDVMS